ncbi:hypothetical protein K7432_013898 [Basidiobolus ranarum]|uniref:E3 ubiquitin ligase complex SCF subunit n=1 Tax=Basidiobolus ranarum TaxID=34480 RepID=A0ABR2WIG2_9FUNG
MVNVQTSDGKAFNVDEALAKHSPFLEYHVERNEDVIRLVKVNGGTFSKILEYLNHHKQDPIFEHSDVSKEDFSEWDKEFVNVDQETLLELLEAAQYLDIFPLIALAGKSLTSILNNPDSHELHSSIENDATIISQGLTFF